MLFFNKGEWKIYSRSEAISKIDSQRRAIREHIEKYYRYEGDYDKF